MSNRPVPSNPEDYMTDVLARLDRLVKEAKEMTPEQRDKEILRWVGLSLDGVLHAAALLRVKEELGEDIDALGLGNLGYALLRVAHGSAFPELVQRFAHRSLSLLRKLVTYTPKEQLQIVQGRVPYVTYAGGKRDVMTVDPAKVEDGKQLDQLFARNGIRSEKQQILYLDAKEKEHRAEPEKVGPATIDKEMKTCKIGGVIVTRETLLRILEVMG